MTDLDFKLLESYESPGVFIRIDPEVESKLCGLPEVHDRVSGCVEFCYLLHAGRVVTYKSFEETLSTEDVINRRRFLRAALSEYASMEDAAICDFRQNRLGAPLKMRETGDPRIHVIRLLRHSNVHLKSTGLEVASRDAYWEGPDGRQDFKYKWLYARDLGQMIRATRDANKYTPESLARMIEWLESEQMEWGIGHAVLRTAELYAKTLLGNLASSHVGL